MTVAPGRSEAPSKCPLKRSSDFSFVQLNCQLAWGSTCRISGGLISSYFVRVPCERAAAILAEIVTTAGSHSVRV
jgi:hypothetical protein